MDLHDKFQLNRVVSYRFLELALEICQTHLKDETELGECARELNHYFECQHPDVIKDSENETPIPISEDVKDETLDFQVVNSSALYGVGYDKTTKSLLVQFNNKKRYVYQGVSEETYNMLMGAKSKGNAFNLMIQGNYSHKEL